MASNDIIANYNLPKMDDLQAEFGFFEVEKDEEFVDTIVSKLRDRVDTFVKVIEDLLRPDSSIVSMQEAPQFANKDQELFELFREFAHHERKYLLVQLENTEAAKAKYFNEYFIFWQGKKTKVQEIVTHAIAVWNGGSEDSKKDNTSGYFG